MVLQRSKDFNLAEGPATNIAQFRFRDFEPQVLFNIYFHPIFILLGYKYHHRSFLWDSCSHEELIFSVWCGFRRYRTILPKWRFPYWALLLTKQIQFPRKLIAQLLHPPTETRLLQIMIFWISCLTNFLPVWI